MAVELSHEWLRQHLKENKQYKIWNIIANSLKYQKDIKQYFF